MMIPKNKRSWMMVLLLSSQLISCGTSEEMKLNHYINEVKSRPARPIEPMPEFKPLATFLYPEDDQRRSPFKPRLLSEDKFAPNIKRPKQPLEAFPLDALKFVGILKQGPKLWALIKEPNGFVLRVKVGDYMGQNYGEVVNIKDKLLEISESIQLNGKWKRRRITLDLSVPD